MWVPPGMGVGVGGGVEGGRGTSPTHSYIAEFLQATRCDSSLIVLMVSVDVRQR